MKRTEEQPVLNYGPGYVYVASNKFMPGIVKVGRTGGLVKQRLRTLYTTGVPGRFKAEGERFFAECCNGEQRMHEALGRLGRRCPNREFYEVPATLAVEALDELYATQHRYTQASVFEWQLEEAYAKYLSAGNITAAEHVFDAINLLPEERHETLKLQLLFEAMHQRQEAYAMWLVSSKKVDPEVPVGNPRRATGIPNYNLTAFEYSILLGLTRFEHYLVRHGCDLRKSVALSLMVDALINGPRTFDSLQTCANFAVTLVNRGACVHWPVTAGLFSAARRKHCEYGEFDFAIFPRSSSLSCIEIAKRLAVEDRWLAKIHQAMIHRSLT